MNQRPERFMSPIRQPSFSVLADDDGIGKGSPGDLAPVFSAYASYSGYPLPPAGSAPSASAAANASYSSATSSAVLAAVNAASSAYAAAPAGLLADRQEWLADLSASGSSHGSPYSSVLGSSANGGIGVLSGSSAGGAAGASAGVMQRSDSSSLTRRGRISAQAAAAARAAAPGSPVGPVVRPSQLSNSVSLDHLADIADETSRSITDSGSDRGGIGLVMSPPLSLQEGSGIVSMSSGDDLYKSPNGGCRSPEPVAAQSSSSCDNLVDVLPPFAWVADLYETLQKRDLPIGAVAAILLTEVIQRTQSTTTTEIHAELELASKILLQHRLMLRPACQMFINYVTRGDAGGFSDIEMARGVLVQRGRTFQRQAEHSREVIAAYAKDFIRDSMVILTHGRSRVVVECLAHASRTCKFTVLVTESRADSDGLQTVTALRDRGIENVHLLLDAAVGHYMQRIDMVLFGAELVVENGGCLSHIGTFQIAVLAKEMNRPVYVAAENHKFSREFPLAQDDLPKEFLELNSRGGLGLPCDLRNRLPIDIINQSLCPIFDYTPPRYINLLFSNLGVLTPSAVSDTLVQLYT